MQSRNWPRAWDQKVWEIVDQTFGVFVIENFGNSKIKIGWETFNENSKIAKYLKNLH